MQKQGWVILFQRAKTQIGEIDLIFEKNNKILLIEVKKLNNSWRAFERIGAKQANKLQNNLIYFSNRFRQFQFFAQLCWVDRLQKVYFVELD
jgi:Holliday junction resolvase-like predicted endonuclease